MKLKKIASLALAGIMAVSMLAGCKDNPSSSSEPTNPVTPADIVSVVDKAIEDYNSDLTVDVKTINTMNTRLEKLFEDNVYSELAAKSYTLITDELKDVFGVNGMTNMMNNAPTNDIKGVKADASATNYFYAIIPVEHVSSATAVEKAANIIADKMTGVDNEFRKTDGGTDKSYTASYTMYVSQLNATKTGDSSVPVVIVVMKQTVAQKV